jgi:hypothetical protein
MITSTFSAIFIAAQVFFWWHKGNRKRIEGDDAGVPIVRRTKREKSRRQAPALHVELSE